MKMEPAHLVFLVALLVYIAIRGTFQMRTRDAKKAHRRGGLREPLLVLLVVVGKIVLPLVFLFTPWLDFADYRLPRSSLFVGAPLMAVALWLFWRSHVDLGKSWSVGLELNPDHRLVTGGVYRRVRHPMYASFFLFGIAQTCLLNNWLAGWSTLVAVALLYAVRVPHEERMMLDSFGAEYRTYMQGTGGVVPRRAIKAPAP